MALLAAVALLLSAAPVWAAPFANGSLTVLRVGDATGTGPTDTKYRQMFFDEYTYSTWYPSVLTLRQSIALPAAGSATTYPGVGLDVVSCVSVPSVPSITGLSTAGDGLSIVATCFNNTVGTTGSGGSNFATSTAMRLFVQANPNGDLSFSAVGLGTVYYFAGQVAAITSSILYAGVSGGSASGDGSRYVVPGATALGATTYGGVSGTAATNGAGGTSAWRYASTLLNPGFIASYGTYGGNLYMFSTIDPYVSPPFTGFIISKGYATASWRYYLDVQNTAYVTYTNTTQLANPRGFVVANYSAIWACDLNTGVYLFGNFSSNGQTLYGVAKWLTLGGPYTIPGESQYNSVALSTDGIILYVVASKGVYGLYTASGLWVSNSTGGSLLVAAQTGSALRGIALSPNYPQ